MLATRARAALSDIHIGQLVDWFFRTLTPDSDEDIVTLIVEYEDGQPCRACVLEDGHGEYVERNTIIRVVPEEDALELIEQSGLEDDQICPCATITRDRDE